MSFNPKIHNRQSYRLKNYDYSSEGFYFVTVLTKKREHVLSDIIENKVHLKTFGQFLEDQWLKTPSIRPNIAVNDYVIMPDHFHGIVEIKFSKRENPDAFENAFFESPSQSLGACIRGLKIAVMKDVKNWKGLESVDKIETIWHRNYHDRIIRNQDELQKIQRYIAENPKRWKG